MHTSILQKLNQIVDRYRELNLLLADPEVISNRDIFRKSSIELAQLAPIVEAFDRFQLLKHEVAETRLLLNDSDDAMRDMAREELPGLECRLEAGKELLQILLLPNDPNDSRNVILEIRAGTGGDEAALFAGDLYRMYSAYAESRSWKVEVLSSSLGEHGGYKEIISRVAGDKVNSRLKFESGAHRVQRVPETESQGRVHTSACTVAVLLEAEEMDDIEINPVDIRIDTFRSSGAGGQHVNKTDSAIRITHLFTGMVVECQDDRSQHKNRAQAMSVLKSRLLQARIQQRQQEQASTRKSMVGSGDRSERIRTYNYPQNRVTDHRINLTLYKLEEILSGSADQIIEPLIYENRANMLASLDHQDD